jgi:hypothetical protein
MPEARYPHVTFTAQLTGAISDRDKPRQSFRSTVCKDLKAVGIPHQGGEWYVQARDKSLWRQLVQGMPSTQVTPTSTRIQPTQACKR